MAGEDASSEADTVSVLSAPSRSVRWLAAELGSKRARLVGTLENLAALRARIDEQRCD